MSSGFSVELLVNRRPLRTTVLNGSTYALAAPGGEAVLADNAMGDRALAAIAAALKVAPATKSLQSLELQGNSFTVGGGMLKKTPPAVKAIEEACKRGKVRVHLKKQGGGTL